MLASKPTIKIYTEQPDPDALRDLCAGIEEEGLFFDVIESGEAYPHPESKGIRSDILAGLAARDSMLGVGVGLCRTDASLSIFSVGKGTLVLRTGRKTCRLLGGDAARIIKRMPLRLG